MTVITKLQGNLDGAAMRAMMVAFEDGNGVRYFTPQTGTGRGEARFLFNYLPCSGCGGFECMIDGHDGGSRPL
jgi:hypothetical protein